jgi:hypothetical protein
MSLAYTVVSVNVLTAQGICSPRSYDLHSAQIRKSDDLDNARAKINAFWHMRLQCKSYQRRAQLLPERERSGRWSQAAPCLGPAGDVPHPPTPDDPIVCSRMSVPQPGRARLRLPI